MGNGAQRGQAPGERSPAPPRGRPRSAEADQAILTAALRHLSDKGYSSMTMDAVAGEAGVSKATVYRRYSGKAELAAAAVASMATTTAPPDTGNLASDLESLAKETRELMSTGPGMAMIGTLLVEEHRTPELIHLFREWVIAPRRACFAEVLRRAVDRGEVRADTDFEAATEMVVGALFARLLSGLAATDEWMRSVIGALYTGIRV